MNIGDRSRVRLLDKLAKQHGWRSLCIVGVKDDLEAKSLIQWCRNLAVTVVWQQRRDGTRQERQRQQMARDRMRKWTAVYKRLSLVEMSPADAAEELADRQYDAVALWGLSPAELAFTGAQWAALVRDGGSLVGTGHRLPEVRGILNAAVPKWRQLRDGVWLVEVKRSHDVAEIGSEGILPDGQLVGRDIDDPVVITHDPVDSGSGADEAVHDVAPVTDDIIAPPAPKRRGGRPKGSRNKPKVAVEQ